MVDEVRNRWQRISRAVRTHPLQSSIAVLVLIGGVVSALLGATTPTSYTGCGYGYSGYGYTDSGYGYTGYAFGYGTCPPSVSVPPTTVPTPPPAPTGAVSSTTGSSTTQSGTATASNDGTTATATGIGALRVSQFSSDPVGAPTFSSNGEWFDIRLSTNNTFTSLDVKDTNLNGGNAVTWWNPSANGGVGAWEPVSPQSYNPGPPPYVSFTITATSSPSLSQLTGTVFAVGTAPTVTSIAPTTGPATGGTKVTITGTNLSGATAVDFGTTAASGVTVVSSTEVTAVSPAGTGTVNVTVTTPTGTSAVTSTDEFTYQVSVVPSAEGYYILTNNGSVFGFGNAAYDGSAFGKIGTEQAVSMARGAAG